MGVCVFEWVCMQVRVRVFLCACAFLNEPKDEETERGKSFK